jgi:drug/metabolite transporter (DMT)-like permease
LSPLLLALGASLAWGIADFVGPLFARGLGTLRVLFWAQVGGVVAIAAAVAIRGVGPEGWAVAWAALAAISGGLGILAYYQGMASGTMSVVAPIAGASAAIPVLIGIATGDRPSGTQLAGIFCAILGVVLASLEHRGGTPRLAAGVGLALLAAIGFGFYFTPMHEAGHEDFWWASLVFRTTMLLLVSGIVLARRPPLRVTRRELVILLLIGAGDMIGNACFAAASGSGLVSLTAVLASLYPIVTVCLAVTVLREQIALGQKLGIVLTLAGVILISS